MCHPSAQYWNQSLWTQIPRSTTTICKWGMQKQWPDTKTIELDLTELETSLSKPNAAHSLNWALLPTSAAFLQSSSVVFNTKYVKWLYLNYAWVEHFSLVSEFPSPKEPAIFPKPSNEPQPHTRHPVHSQQRTTVYEAKDPGTPPQNPVPQYCPDKIVIPISSLYYACPYVAIFNPWWFMFDLNFFAFKFKLHV